MSLTIFSDEHFMTEALKEAEIALTNGEIPVGAIVVWKNRIIARAHHQTEKLSDSTAHAEMIALTSSFNYAGAKYLPECTLYITLEPCVMCAGATYWAQLNKIVYGASDPKRGYSLISDNITHPKTQIVKGIMADECRNLIDHFFKEIRRKNKK